MRENRLYMPLLWQISEYCEKFRLYRLQVVQANGSRQGTPLYNRPCIVGACASPNKNRLHTERHPEMSMLKFWIYGGILALFRLQFCGMWVIMDISIITPVWACKHSTSAPKIGNAWPPAEPCKASGQSVTIWHLWTNYEIVPKSRANFEKILFRFFVWEIHI